MCSRSNELEEQYKPPECQRKEAADLAGAGAAAIRAGRGSRFGQGSAPLTPACAAARSTARAQALACQQSKQHYASCKWP